MAVTLPSRRTGSIGSRSTGQALAAVADTSAKLPPAAEKALVAHVLADPAERRDLRLALLRRRSLPYDLAASLAQDTRLTLNGSETVAWLTRPGHTDDMLTAAGVAEARKTVLMALARDPWSAPALLDGITRGKNFDSSTHIQVAAAVLEHALTPPVAALTAVLVVDRHLDTRGVRLLTDTHDTDLLASVARALAHDGVAAEAARGLPAASLPQRYRDDTVPVGGVAAAAAARACNPAMLTALCQAALPEATYRRAIDRVLTDLPTGWSLSALPVVTERLVDALTKNSPTTVRTYAAEQLRTAGVTTVRGLSVDVVLGLHAATEDEAGPHAALLESTWASMALGAPAAASIAYSLAAALSDELGDDEDAWHILLKLADTFTGTVAGLISVASGVGRPARLNNLTGSARAQPPK